MNPTRFLFNIAELVAGGVAGVLVFMITRQMLRERGVCVSPNLIALCVATLTAVAVVPFADAVLIPFAALGLAALLLLFLRLFIDRNPGASKRNPKDPGPEAGDGGGLRKPSKRPVWPPTWPHPGQRSKGKRVGQPSKADSREPVILVEIVPPSDTWCEHPPGRDRSNQRGAAKPTPPKPNRLWRIS
jgi:hypothetical protein